MMPALLRSPVFWMRVVSAVVVVTLALGLARLTWRLTGWDDGRAEVWTPASLAPVGGVTGGDLTSGLAWAPFGGGGAGVGELPVSNLGLVLKGVVYATDGGSTALISNGGGPVQIFAIGESPIGSAVIEAIEVDRVILNAGGRREALLMPNPAGTAAGAAVPPATPSAPPVPTPQVQPAPAASPVAAPSQPNPALPSASSASVLGVTPSSEGYVVGSDTAAHLLRAGLRPGDVISSVNGQALGDPAADQQILQSAAASGRARVEVVRNGRTLTLTVPLR